MGQDFYSTEYPGWKQALTFTFELVRVNFDNLTGDRKFFFVPGPDFSAEIECGCNTILSSGYNNLGPPFSTG